MVISVRRRSSVEGFAQKAQQFGLVGGREPQDGRVWLS
jgi:hypothetical protein